MDTRPFGRPTVRWAQLALIAGLVVAAVGCPRHEDTTTLPLLTTDDPRAEADLRAAREAAEEGRDEEAEGLYRSFLAEHPSDPLVPMAHLGLGRLALAEGELDTAQEFFERVAAHADPSVAERGRFYRGITQHLAGEHSEALETLRPFIGRTVDPDETSLLLATIASASERIGDRVAAVEALDLLLLSSAPEEDRHAALERVAAVIDNEATADEVRTLYERLRHSGPSWPIVARRAAHVAFEEGDMARVRSITEALREQGAEFSEELAAMALRAERSGRADPRVIGAILPLSGRGREVGQLAMRGIMLAAGTPANGPVDLDAPQIVFRDSAGDPERAARAVDDLVSLHRVVAIIGPIDRAASLRAAQRARDLGVAMISLSSEPTITDVGPMTFRLHATPADEAASLLRAAQARGAERIAVMYPEHGYGVAMRDAMRAAVAAQGAELVAEASYAAGATSFRDQVQTLAAATPDAILIPDAPRSVSLVAPALAAAGLFSVPAGQEPSSGRAVTLLLPSVAYQARAVAGSQRYLQGALYSLPFHAPSASGASGAFAAAYEARYTRAPSALAALAFDAYNLVRSSVDGGAETRDELIARLPSARVADAAGPAMGFGPGRGPSTATRIYELRGDTLTAQ